MPVETFHTLIARNRRNSFFLIAGFMLFFVGMGLLIGHVWGYDWGGGVEPRRAAGGGGADWAFSITVAAVAAAVAFVLTLGSYYGGSATLLGLSRARQIKKADDPQLFNVVEELSLAGGVPVPKIYLIDDTAMNAFATGRNPKHAVVAITTGLRQRLSRDELQGVMAHELSHVRHYDILYATLMAVMVGVLVMLCDVFLRSLWFGGGRRRSRSRQQGGGAAQLILLVVALVLAVIAPILARIIQMALSRQREYLADAGSVELTRNPDALAKALAKLAGDKEVLEVANRATAPLYIVHPIKKFEARAKGIFNTHPPVADRIKRLVSLTT
ncbi:MAG: M48 family metallopeptidase [Planctomycetota bacterium]|nr:M48 family metallopeptidase [Planctomycetota bacterium]